METEPGLRHAILTHDDKSHIEPETVPDLKTRSLIRSHPPRCQTGTVNDKQKGQAPLAYFFSLSLIISSALSNSSCVLIPITSRES